LFLRPVVAALLCFLSPLPPTSSFAFVGTSNGPHRHRQSQASGQRRNADAAVSFKTANTALHAATLNDTSVDARGVVNGRKQPTSSSSGGGAKRPPPTVTIEPTPKSPQSSTRRSFTSPTPQAAPPAPKSLRDSLVTSSISSAGAVAFAAVNAAVALQSLEAPDVSKSYIARGPGDAKSGPIAGRKGGTGKVAVDENGLPLVYDKALIEAYWKSQRGALNQRWSDFVNKAIPFLTKLVTLYIRDGAIMDSEIPALSRQARMDLQDLGPTFIKAGQMMSVRPDVLTQATLDELAYLQDSVVPFDSDVARRQIEAELGGPLSDFFATLSEEPIAAASLAQVYSGTLLDGTKVAVKVQRPNVLGTVSKDLYVLRRAAEVWQGLVKRFAPQQRTDYVALLNEWAVGFYTELDFLNEAQNQKRLRQLLLDRNVTGVVVPKVFEECCTRRVLVSEWIDGTKLSQCSMEQIAQVTPQAQEAFLTQLFEVGFFHADPHPGTLRSNLFHSLLH
jgi:ABC1 atypical kinase-like domain